MSIVKTVAEIEAWFSSKDRRNKTLGFVPTMGFLHGGHLSLIKAAKAQNDLVVVSVFVNPTQFAPGEDYESYPRDIDRDYQLAREAGADVVFNPNVDEIYIPGASTAVEVTGDITKKLCGASRPTHFKGVTTVVNILFNIVKPDRAYFGQKDAQQALVIKRMVRDLHMPVEVVVCPIVREVDGLAMSSRNVYLSSDERQQATCLNEALQKAADYLGSGADDCGSVAQLIKIIEGHIQRQDLAAIDYVLILDGETLDDIELIEPGKSALAAVAVKFGKTRLIDNRVLAI
ncbi:MAG TPA: pantoate--beta-alanine ligase [Firmicutes bacterium]|nr:pantoate--beta-alanine ligase [Bacillota bacterium]HAZ21514.1 pantoate--beta-alanine ligase [Bacillota bacterium]HBE05640.1 pantoate--beta-alanine ligase [Bacillota bacterium]HBG45182.1 pantoate--beta-alanine ligase [Bacillota bacterium]HBL50016.1 pantoate--beta-alanine ligase [Bacillota bacterium]